MDLIEAGNFCSCFIYSQISEHTEWYNYAFLLLSLPAKWMHRNVTIHGVVSFVVHIPKAMSQMIE